MKIKTCFETSHKIRARPSASASRLDEAVAEAAGIIARLKPPRAAGVMVDSSVHDGAILQGFINHLPDDFHFYGYEGRSRHYPAMKQLVDANHSRIISLRFAGMTTRGERDISQWLGQTYASYADQDGQGGPFIAFTMSMGAGALRALDTFGTDGHLPKIGALVAAFHPEFRAPYKGWNAALETKLRAASVPIIELHL